ncbi:MAG: GGDEF domain-containing protein [Lachnospiraceae bacterium]|nr:GGDEF domain-containing protein [Lachnospiraceae bacterium]
MRYDRQTQDLLKEIAYLRDMADKRILSQVARLKKTATALGDSYLLGFTYYHSAFAKYYYKEDHGDFTADLARAAKHLVNSGDHALLARVFNFIAVDAHAYGCYHIAYDYYMNAMQEIRSVGDAVVEGVLETNLALVFFELDDLKQAKKHSRAALKLLSGRETDVTHVAPRIRAYLNEAFIRLESREEDAARAAFGKAERLNDRHAIFGQNRYVIPQLILRIRFALRDNSAQDLHLALASLVSCFAEEMAIVEYMPDVDRICRALLKENELTACGQIIDVVNERLKSSRNAHAMRIFNELKVDHYTACGNTRMLKKALAEQEEMLAAQHTDINSVYRYTLDLVRLDNELRNAQIRASRENIHLKKRAYHDALTGIANRHMLTKMLEGAFERARDARTLLGIEVLDIDCLKEYNDTYGHSEGDTCIIRIASEINRISEEHLPQNAAVFCGRYGGDEFLLIYEGMDRERILSLAGLLTERIAQLAIPNINASVAPVVTISQGLCIDVPGLKSKVWDYLSAADKAMYSVKSASRAKREKTGGIAYGTLPAEESGEEYE